MTEEILYEVKSTYVDIKGIVHPISIQVIDKKNVRHLRFGNSIRQASINKTKPFELQTKYTRDMVKVFDHYTVIPEIIMVLGLGAGILPTYLYNKFPRVELTNDGKLLWTKIFAIEILPELKEIASDYFGMPQDERLEVVVKDALEHIMSWPVFLNDGSLLLYDLIFVDLFCDKPVKLFIPGKFTEQEFYTRIKNVLAPGGYAVLNTWIDPSSYGNYINTLENVFDTVIEESVPKSGNHVAFCK